MIDNKVRALRRQSRVRTKIAKTTKRTARLVVFKSNSHISCQIVDTEKNVTLASASSTEKFMKKLNASNCNIQSAKAIGELISSRAKEKDISKVVFDRGRYKYHGVIKAFCDGARKHLNF
jgi:large subunit ribosomal protein L18